MCFLTLEDETCSIDNVVVFPETTEKTKYILDEGLNLLFCGEVEKDGSFIINKILTTTSEFWFQLRTDKVNNTKT